MRKEKQKRAAKSIWIEPAPVRALNFFAFPWKLVLHEGEERIHFGLVDSHRRRWLRLTASAFLGLVVLVSEVVVKGSERVLETYLQYIDTRCKMRVFEAPRPGTLHFGWLDWDRSSTFEAATSARGTRVHYREWFRKLSWPWNHRLAYGARVPEACRWLPACAEGATQCFMKRER